MSKPLNQFLTTGLLPTSAREKSALLAVLRNQILSTNQLTKPMTPPSAPPEAIITASMTKNYMIWKRSNPSGTAQQFIAAKTAPKPSATIAAFAVGIDPANLPRLENGMLDGLAISNALGRQKAAELASASAAVSKRNAPKRTVINRSKYSV